MTGPLLPRSLSTPSTIVFVDRLERNLSSMAEFAAGVGIALRPHAKTHKCPEIAHRQMALGARGISVATIGEAEILTAGCTGGHAEVTDVFIAYPLWADGDAAERICDITEHAGVRIGTDSVPAVQRLAPLAGRISVMVEIDCGLGRSGVPPAVAPLIAAEASRLGIEVAGVFTFPGHSYRPGGSAKAAADEAAALTQAQAAMSAAGFGALERSGGSTPSAHMVHPDTVTEMRPGVYVFNDAQQVELGVAGFDDVALMLAATVVSRPEAGKVVLDAGSKVLGPDRAPWASGHGRLAEWPDARITGLWEHHAVVATNGLGPALGDVVAVVPNHVCTAVNLVPELVIVDAGEVVDRWPVAARAANR